MSFEALAQLRDVAPPSSSALLLLFILAEYAGPDGLCFPSQETLSERSKLSVRAVRDNLRLLVDAGLIATARRCRKDGTRTSDEIRLAYYVPEQAPDTGRSPRRRKAQPPADSAGGDMAGKPNGDSALDENDYRQIPPVDNRQITSRQPAMVAGLTSFEPVSEPITCRARELDEIQSRIEAAYPAKGIGFSNTHAVRLALEALDQAEVDLAALPAAAARYAADPILAKREYGPVKLERWLGEGRYRGWLGEGTSSAAGPPAASGAVWAGPAALRAALAGRAGGEAPLTTTLDVAGWDAATRTITPRTTFARDRLRDWMRGLPEAEGITLAEPAKQQATGV